MLEKKQYVECKIKCEENTQKVLKAAFYNLIDCSSCSGCCCNGDFFNHVMLTDKELETISLNLKMPNLKEHCIIKEHHGMNFHCFPQPCMFLSPDYKCQIYQFRPQACRDFPLNINDDMVQICVSCPAGNKIYTDLINKMDEHTKEEEFLNGKSTS